MTQQTLSIMEVLRPPSNPWLMTLSRRKAVVPAGVRILRVNYGDSSQPAKRRHAPTKPE